jgi:GNAT superfamily N-acetyltransferase
MVIRTALPSEAQDLAVLGRRLWRETYAGLIPESNLAMHLAATFGPVQQAAELADPACRTLVVEEEGGALLGYALLRACGPEEERASFHFVKPLEVARFYLDGALHGTGAARDLMDAVLAQAASAGHDGVWLQVWERGMPGPSASTPRPVLLTPGRPPTGWASRWIGTGCWCTA